MTCQFGATGRQRLQDTNQAIDADHAGQGRTIICLPIEATAISDFWRATSERNSEAPGDLQENGAGGLTQVNVLVRIEVSRRISHQAIEYAELAVDFISYRRLTI
jgi:hypothetical protein